MRLSPFVAGIALVASLTMASVRAEAATGELRCSIAGGFGLLVTSDRRVSCVYYRPDGGVEFYVGSSGRLGLDVGPTNALRLAYSVVTPDPSARAALEGDFEGVGFQITAGSGIGADALQGGRGGAVQLLPLANVNVTGLNANAGIGLLHLRYAGMERSR